MNSALQKIDYKKDLKTFYKPSAKMPEIVDVPAFQFLMIDGRGTTESAEFKSAIQALFGVSFKAKFLVKKQKSFDYVVMPLEGLWWADDMQDFVRGDKEQWKWTLMIFQPDVVDREIFDEAVREAARKEDSKALHALRLESYEEGLSAQIMHIGPFSEEHKNILKLHDSIREQGGRFDGKRQKHHEIYLSDFRKVDPQKMKTVLRQPFIK
jgi:hypothetical protein